MRSIGRRFGLLFFAAWFLVLPVAAQEAIPLDLRLGVEHVDAMARDEFEQDDVGSVAIGIVDGADLIWTKSYGYADMELESLADRNTVYRVGSITKQFTALMLLQLADAGIVRLSDPVEIYFPEINRVQDRIPDAPPITLVQLATMTSGLAREPDDLATYLRGPVSEWEQVLIAALGEDPLFTRARHALHVFEHRVWIAGRHAGKGGWKRVYRLHPRNGYLSPSGWRIPPSNRTTQLSLTCRRATA